MSGKTKILIVVGIALVFGVSTGYRAWHESRTYALMIVADGVRDGNQASVRMMRKGVEKPLDEWTYKENYNHTSLSNEIPLDELVMEVKTPEGWVPCQMKQKVEGRHVTLSLHFGQVAIWIDNEQGPAAELVCGEERFSVPARCKATMRFATPLKNAVPLKLGDKTLGEISACVHQDDDFLHDVGYLVDCRGNQQYSYEEIVYASEQGADLGSHWAPSKQQFAYAQLYKLPFCNVDYFLTKAPTSYTVKSSGPVIVKERRHVVQITRD